MVVFKLICDYLDVMLVEEDDQAMQAHVYSHKTCMMAQFPLSIAVRYCLGLVLRYPIFTTAFTSFGRVALYLAQNWT